jgi:hypothetical protein
MNNRFDLHPIVAGLALLLLEATSLARATTPAAPLAPASVEIAARYQAALHSTYGEREGTVLRSYILDSTSEALRSAHGECSLDLDIVLERAAPTHPTMKQQLDNPALDPFRSVFVNGGAALTGYVRGADGRTLATVKDEYFADQLPIVSAGKDPWSDARLAIGQFAAKLVKACSRQASTADPPSH